MIDLKKLAEWESEINELVEGSLSTTINRDREVIETLKKLWRVAQVARALRNGEATLDALDEALAALGA